MEQIESSEINQDLNLNNNIIIPKLCLNEEKEIDSEN